jgi:hypothetical protein
MVLSDALIEEEMIARAAVIDHRWAYIEPRLAGIKDQLEEVNKLVRTVKPSLQSILVAHGMKHAKLQIQAAQEVGCDMASSCTTLIMETAGGWSEWGSDPVANPVRGSNGYHWVDRDNYEEYLKYRNEGDGCQGCSSTQLTSAGLQNEADELGGCYVVEHNMHIGFLFIHQLQKEYGLQGGFEHYNGSGPAAVAYGEHAMAIRNSFAEVIG